jgi:hypothetical protein
LPGVATTLTGADGGVGVGGLGGDGDAAIVMVMVDVVVVPFAFVALMANVYVPAVAGVPESTPVESSNVRPGGNEPLAMLNPIALDGELLAVKVYDAYATPTTPESSGESAVK